jgi:hypothetical protein
MMKSRSHFVDSIVADEQPLFSQTFCKLLLLLLFSGPEVELRTSEQDAQPQPNRLR